MTLKTSALRSFYGGLITVITQLKNKQTKNNNDNNIFVSTSAPTQHHSFFRSSPSYVSCLIIPLLSNILFIFVGMDEAIGHLERLNEYNFHLPEDLAIRHLTKINDAFGES